MGQSKISTTIKSVQKAVSKHSPEILTGIGIAGMITTTVLAVKATPKAVTQIKYDSEFNHGGDPDAYTKKEAIKSAWKYYIPAAVTGTVSIACLIGASSVNARRNAALATAYKLSETALTEYREKVIETIGEKKEKGIQEKVIEKKIKDNPVNNNEVIITGTGNTLCYDPMSGRYFYSTIEKIKAAENKLNKQMIHDLCGYASLNDFYDELGLSHTEVGEIVGWNTDSLIDVDITAQLSDDSRPCIGLVYYTRPDYNFDN